MVPAWHLCDNWEHIGTHFPTWNVCSHAEEHGNSHVGWHVAHLRMNACSQMETHVAHLHMNACSHVETHVAHLHMMHVPTWKVCPHFPMLGLGCVPTWDHFT
jgi:hypothetical protein